MDLPNLFIPSVDSFVEVRELPLLGSGKMDLKRLREIARDHFGSTSN
jgi:acyl-[acyl-carrier-protein]-phospholipid O-acyltransferase/long-chain-fatty-acid--[acyl-carrier-protein] ligase